MKFGLSNELLIKHIMLHDSDLVGRLLPTVQQGADKAEETEGDKGRTKFIDHEAFEVKMTINGEEVDFHLAENYFQAVYTQMKSSLDRMYEDQEKLVQQRLEERFKNEVAPTMEKLLDLHDRLNQVSDMIKPYWEK